MSYRIRSLLLGAVILAACGEKAPAPGDNPEATLNLETTMQDPASLTYAPVTGVDLSQMTLAPEGYYWQDLEVGSGDEAVAGQTLAMDYTGWLADGSEFDSSIPRGTPYEYVLGGQQVIPGWDIAPVGMRVGGSRLIVLPADLAYGAMGSPPVIPGGAVLVFKLDLRGIK